MWETLTWAAAVAGLFGSATLFAEKLVSRQRSDEFAALVHIRDDATWVQHFLSAFDALFTANNFTIARLFRSIVATAIGVVALWVLFDPILGLMRTRSDQAVPLGQALALGLAINFVADFLSLAETRWVLSRFRHVRSALGHVLLLLADLVFTATVIWLAIAIFRFLQGQPILHPIELIAGYSVYAIFFYSTFLTSIWAWGYALAIMIVRILSSKAVERISNFEKPFAWLAGLVSVVIFVLILAIETFSQNMPDDLDSRICNTFGGVLCTHAARLTPDEEIVVALLTRACYTGDPAQCRVVLDVYGSHEGPQAARWLENALRFLENGCDLYGDAIACNTLGFFYHNGLEVAQDYPRAIELYTRACEGEFMTGCSNLGLLFDEGLGVAQDYPRAHALYSRACAGGDMLGCNNLGSLYHEGLGVAQDYTRAHELYTRACEGSMAGCNNLGSLYRNGLGVTQDYTRAHELYTRACEGGSVAGCNNLGHLYRHGLGVAQDHARALELYTRACDGGGEGSAACESLRGFLRSE